MNKQYALVFPGQGSQQVGMALALAEKFASAREVLEQASGSLGYDVIELCKQGPIEKLNQTQITQPLMLAADIASYAAWCSLAPEMPCVVAGHSLGEFAALVAAGALSFTDALKLVEKRAQLMQDAVPVGAGAMAAIIGMDLSLLTEVCAEASEGEVVAPANLNAPGQIVISGEAGAVKRAAELAKTRGAKLAKMLPVSVPSHCQLMAKAAEAFNQALAAISFQKPTVPVIHNADVAQHQGEDAIRTVLSAQLTQPVRWVETVEKIQELGITTCFECGPGKVLLGLNRRIARGLEGASLAEPGSMQDAFNTLTKGE